MKADYRKLSVVMVLFVVISMLLTFYQLRAYDESVLDIYARQQDAYVQLVLDQINIQSDRSDEEIVTEILGSLDASNSRYWTLSKEQALLFVKDVMETNRYKGFTPETYYISESASEFMEGLSVNHVVHQNIEIEENEYVASGAAFTYNGGEYRICLLTNREVIMENNDFLSAKISLMIIVTVILFVLLILTLVLTALIQKRDRENEGLAAHVEEQNRTIDGLVERIKGLDIYQTRWNLFNETVLASFLEKLQKRQSFPIVLMQLRFHREEEKAQFLEAAQLLLDKRVLRFSVAEDSQLLLIFVQYKKQEALNAMYRVRQKNQAKLVGIAVWEDGESTLQEAYARMKEQVEKDGAKTVS